jgi:lipoprotein NlpD
MTRGLDVLAESASSNDGMPMNVELTTTKLPAPVSAPELRRAALLLGLAAGLLLAGGCANHSQAPVTERSPAGARAAPAPVVAQPAPVPGAPAAHEPRTYTVKKGDTLYVIALDHGQDYKDVAAWNNIDHPDRISVGQVLRMDPPQSAPATGSAQVGVVVPHQPVEARPLGSASSAAPSGNTAMAKSLPKTGKEAYSDQAATAAAAGTTQLAKADSRPEERSADDEDRIDWGWPVHGKMLGGFSESTNKGVDIAGKVGDPVVASASGKVILAGNSLRGYGKLIIIKHNANYLSVYAHNNEILVKEGQSIVKGQKIAEVGSTDAEQPMLHFEIRRQGKPVDPLKFLPASG